MDYSTPVSCTTTPVAGSTVRLTCLFHYRYFTCSICTSTCELYHTYGWIHEVDSRGRALRTSTAIFFSARASKTDEHAESLASSPIDHDNAYLHQFLIFRGASWTYIISLLIMSENTLKLHRNRTRYQFVRSSFNAVLQDS